MVTELSDLRDVAMIDPGGLQRQLKRWLER